jgi:hypothetical protein
VREVNDALASSAVDDFLEVLGAIEMVSLLVITLWVCANTYSSVTPSPATGSPRTVLTFTTWFTLNSWKVGGTATW